MCVSDEDQKYVSAFFHNQRVGKKGKKKDKKKYEHVDVDAVVQGHIPHRDN